jgi:predicted RNA-binding protein with PIN domain
MTARRATQGRSPALSAVDPISGGPEPAPSDVDNSATGDVPSRAVSTGQDAGEASGTGAGPAGGPADGEAAERDAPVRDGTDQTGLPEPVRQRVLALAADTLGRLPVEEVPASLRSAARFTPAKRARLAGTAIAAALDGDAAFRLSVARQAELETPAAAEAVRAGEEPGAADPVELAVAAYLLRVEGWHGYVERARAARERAAELARTRQRDEEVVRLRGELDALRASVRAEVDRIQAASEAARAEVDALRRQLREQTGQRRAAERARAAAEEALAEERRRAAAAESTGGAELRRLRQRLAEAEDAVESARRAARESRQADEARLWLLLDTVTGAVHGLRRELALTPTEGRPADAVLGAAAQADVMRARGDDPELLDRLLELPRVHLVVDGYNVTKSGYGDLPLAAQRNRLVQGLGALAARTGAEVSCVFDGAARPPVAPVAPRGVRVLFSAPGEAADDLIRRLVAAEPEGRPVVVVTSDREVAEGVRRLAVYPVGSGLLLRRLDRG